MVTAQSNSAGDARHALQWALSRLTVSDLVACKATLRTFHDFLATGTLMQRKRLCPSKVRALRAPTPDTPRTPRSLPPTPRLTSPRAPTAPPTSTPPTSTPPTSTPPTSTPPTSTPPPPPPPPNPPKPPTSTRPPLPASAGSPPRRPRRLVVTTSTSSRRRRALSTEASLSPFPPPSPSPSPSPSTWTTSPSPSPSPTTLGSVVGFESPPSSPCSSAVRSSGPPSPRSSPNTTCPASPCSPTPASPCSPTPASPCSPTPASMRESPTSPSPPPSPSSSWCSEAPMELPEAKVVLQAHSFFKRRLGARQSRAHYLVRAIQGFMDSSDISPDFAQEIWLSRPDIFAPAGGTGLVARLRRLYDGHCRIKKSRDDYSCADRLCYIFLDHDLQQLLQSDELVMSQGRGRKTAALRKQAADISTTVDELRANRKAGSGYRHLLKQGGPGFLLQMGSQVSTIWERKLSKCDIDLVLEFLETEVPEVYAKGKALDAVAARALVGGFLAYGWTLSELAATQTKLIDQLKLHVSISAEPRADESPSTEEGAGSPLYEGQSTCPVPFSECGSAHHPTNMETSTNLDSPLSDAAHAPRVPRVRLPARNPASSPSAPPCGAGLGDHVEQLEYHNSPAASETHAPSSEPWFYAGNESIECQLLDAEQLFCGQLDTPSWTQDESVAVSTPWSTLDLAIMEEDDSLFFPTTPMSYGGRDVVDPNIFDSSNIDLYLLSGMDLDSPISSNHDSTATATGSSSEEQSSPTPTLTSCQDSVMATTTDICADNWMCDLYEMDMGEGGPCLLSSPADIFCDIYLSPGEVYP